MRLVFLGRYISFYRSWTSRLDFLRNLLLVGNFTGKVIFSNILQLKFIKMQLNITNELIPFILRGILLFGASNCINEDSIFFLVGLNVFNNLFVINNLLGSKILLNILYQGLQATDQIHRNQLVITSVCKRWLKGCFKSLAVFVLSKLSILNSYSLAPLLPDF